MQIIVSDVTTYDCADRPDTEIRVDFKPDLDRKGARDGFRNPPEVHLGLNGFVLNMAPGMGHPDVTLKVDRIDKDGFVARVFSNPDLGVITHIRFSYIALGD